MDRGGRGGGGGRRGGGAMLELEARPISTDVIVSGTYSLHAEIKT